MSAYHNCIDEGCPTHRIARHHYFHMHPKDCAAWCPVGKAVVDGWKAMGIAPGAFCTCEKPEPALVKPVFMGVPTDEDWKIIQPLIGQYLCHTCGHVLATKPESFMIVTGDAILHRLEKLRADHAAS